MMVEEAVKKAETDVSGVNSPENPPVRDKKEKTLADQRKSSILFCVVMLALPLLQFFLFYICVNFNSVLMAFQKIKFSKGESIREWIDPLFSNFERVIDKYVRGSEEISPYLWKNSFWAYVFTCLLATPLTLIFSFYIYKKAYAGTFFKIMLFLPSVISSIIMVLIYKQFVDTGLPYGLEILSGEKVRGFWADSNKWFGTVIFYNVWMGFGGTILMYLSAMNSINDSLVEAAELEGVNYLQEFVYITFPMIYPTFTTFFIVGIAGFFTNQLNLVSFVGTESGNNTYKVATFGYFMYAKAAENAQRMTDYPWITAMGILITLVVTPITLTVKHLMEKFGPSAEGR